MTSIVHLGGFVRCGGAAVRDTPIDAEAFLAPGRHGWHDGEGEGEGEGEGGPTGTRSSQDPILPSGP